MARVLITGGAGFIGYHLSVLFLKNNECVYALDNIQDEISGHIKYERLLLLGIEKEEVQYGKLIEKGNYHFIQADINDTPLIEKFLVNRSFDVIIHLAAQTGIRNSLINPDIYLKNNINGFHNILRACIKFHFKKLIFASSSSVYGENKEMPYKENFNTDNPESLYAVTKKTNELLAQTYSNLYQLNTIGLRFFTVYGPWGRTDMAPYIFIKSINEGKTIHLFNNGQSLRDFTFVDDVVKSIYLIFRKITSSESDTYPLFSIFNVGNSKAVVLQKFLSTVEKLLNKKAQIIYKPNQEGDVTATYACVDKLYNFIDFKPDTDIEDGLRKTIDWYIKLKH